VKVNTEEWKGKPQKMRKNQLVKRAENGYQLLEVTIEAERESFRILPLSAFSLLHALLFSLCSPFRGP